MKEKKISKGEYYNTLKARLKTVKIENTYDFFVFFDAYQTSMGREDFPHIKNYLTSTRSFDTINHEYIKSLPFDKLTLLWEDLLYLSDCYTDCWPIEQKFNMDEDDKVGWMIYRQTAALYDAVYKRLKVMKYEYGKQQLTY